MKENLMNIKDLQEKIEDSLEAVQVLSHLPSELQGLRLLAPYDVTPRVTIRNIEKDRRVRSDASAVYFRPQECEVVVRFDSYSDEDRNEAPDNLSSEVDKPQRTEIEELLDALVRAEDSRDFVGLKWFRDHFLPAEGYEWAGDHGRSGRLIRETIDKKLLLTSQISNPRDPMHPTTAIRINRSHPRFRKPPANLQPPEFKPIRIRGKSLSETVLEHRR